MFTVVTHTHIEESTCRLVPQHKHRFNKVIDNNSNVIKAQKCSRNQKSDAKKSTGQKKITIDYTAQKGHELDSRIRDFEVGSYDAYANEETACNIDDMQETQQVGKKRRFAESGLQNAHNSAIKDMMSQKQQKRLSQLASKRMKENYMPSVRIYKKNKNLQLPTDFGDRNPISGFHSLQSESIFKRKTMRIPRLNASIMMPTNNACLFL